MRVCVHKRPAQKRRGPVIHLTCLVRGQTTPTVCVPSPSAPLDPSRSNPFALSRARFFFHPHQRVFRKPSLPTHAPTARVFVFRSARFSDVKQIDCPGFWPGSFAPFSLRRRPPHERFSLSILPVPDRSFPCIPHRRARLDGLFLSLNASARPTAYRRHTRYNLPHAAPPPHLQPPLIDAD